jgi:hypothetical protein
MRLGSVDSTLAIGIFELRNADRSGRSPPSEQSDGFGRVKQPAVDLGVELETNGDFDHGRKYMRRSAA